MSEKIFTFRISAELLDKLRVRAERNKRSIAKELEYIAEQAILQEEDFKKRAISIVKILKSRNATTEEIEEYKNFISYIDKDFQKLFIDALKD